MIDLYQQQVYRGTSPVNHLFSLLLCYLKKEYKNVIPMEELKMDKMDKVALYVSIVALLFSLSVLVVTLHIEV